MHKEMLLREEAEEAKLFLRKKISKMEMLNVESKNEFKSEYHSKEEYQVSECINSTPPNENNETVVEKKQIKPVTPPLLEFNCVNKSNIESTNSPQSNPSTDYSLGKNNNKKEEVILVSELTKSTTTRASTSISNANVYIKSEKVETLIVLDEQESTQESMEKSMEYSMENSIESIETTLRQESLSQDSPSLLIESISELTVENTKEMTQETLNSLQKEFETSQVHPIGSNGQVYYPNLPSLGPYYDYYQSSPLDFNNSTFIEPSYPTPAADSSFTIPLDSPYQSPSLQTPLDPSHQTQTPFYGNPNPRMNYRQSVPVPLPVGMARPIQTQGLGQPQQQEDVSFSSSSITTNEKTTLEQHRQIAKSSSDPSVQLDFVKYLLNLSENIIKYQPDPKKAKKNKILLQNEALKWLKSLSGTSNGIGKSGYADAQFLLAEMHGSGSLGLQIDHEKSFALYQQASKQSHPGAVYRTAVCYELGAGTKKDFGKAEKYYRKACALGDTAAMYKLGMVLIYGGLGIHKNPREGITLLKRAVSQADESTPHALYELGILYEGCNNEETANIIIPDVNYAFELFSRAASLGHAPSQHRLGLSYEHGLLNLPVDPRRSIAWYTKAAEQGDADAELALAGWYLTGSDGILAQSDTDAYLWARKAADKGLAKAEFAVGYFSENGVGVRPDVSEARKWYLRAAAQGNKRSIQRLNELKMIMDELSIAKNQKQRKEYSKTSSNEKECIIM